MTKILIALAILTTLATAGRYILITMPDGTQQECYLWPNGEIDCT